MHYYQHHIGDFLKATSQLPPHMMGGYLRLMWIYYDTEAPLPDNIPVLALKTGMSPDEVALLLEAYFYLQDGVWRHNRCDREIKEYRVMSEKNRQNGKRGGRPRKEPSGNPVETQSVPSGNPVVTQSKPTGNPVVTLTNNQEPITNKTPLPPKGGRFDEFWATWPSSTRKVAKATCEKKWVRLKLDDVADRVLVHVRAMKQTEQWKTGFEPAPLTYLNQKRWEDDLPANDNWMKARML